MVVAALVCFGALVVAWILAPDEPAAERTRHPATEPIERPSRGALPRVNDAASV